MPAEPAAKIVLSYPANLSEWGRDIVEDAPFRKYLRKAHDTAESGAVWEEFVGVGCCGDTLDVPLRVETVSGGTTITDETEIEYREREVCDLNDGWEVQSTAGPST